MIIECEHCYTLFANEQGFSIGKYQTKNPVQTPDGKYETHFSAKGYFLPDAKGLSLSLTGEWEKYKDGYTFSVTDSEIIQPSESDKIQLYLMTLNGIGGKTAEKLYDVFGDNIFSVLENEPERLAEIKGISKKKAERISLSYGKQKYAKELFCFLYPYRIQDRVVIKINHALGKDAVARIKANPYCLSAFGVRFRTTDRIAKDEKLSPTSPERLAAGIQEVLIQQETGGELFRNHLPFPAFVKAFVRPELQTLMENTQQLYSTCGTYMAEDAAYLLLLKLLCLKVKETDFRDICVQMNRNKELVYTRSRLFRTRTAIAEFESANALKELLQTPIEPIADLEEKSRNVCVKRLGLTLSTEQMEAIYAALTHSVSIITGGPGTGKTSVQKGILAVFETIYPSGGICLMAPTGMAAKRMSESTGHPATTIHKALGLYTNDDGEIAETDADFIDAKLIIIDEASMMGSLLFQKVCSRIQPGTNLVLIGDVDQLPSIEIGAVLRELIASKALFVTRLTKMYRQKEGSSIAINAARMKNGTKILLVDDSFTFVEIDGSEEIAKKAAELYVSLAKKKGLDSIACLTAYRKKTESGVNSMNVRFRNMIRTDLNEHTAFFEKAGVRYYEGDRVMYTKNTLELTNGDIGTIERIEKNKGSLTVTALFDNNQVILEDSETLPIEHAYCMTVHKAQGSEYDTVIFIIDKNHQNMLRRNFVYTGATRSKRSLIIVGNKEAFLDSVDCIDSSTRNSMLGELLAGATLSLDETKEQQLTLPI